MEKPSYKKCVMSEELLRAGREVLDRVLALAASDEKLRQSVRRLANELMAITSEKADTAQLPVVPNAAVPVLSNQIPAETNIPPRPVKPPVTPAIIETKPILEGLDLSTLFRGGNTETETPRVITTQYSDDSDADLLLIARRCRLKAEALRREYDRCSGTTTFADTEPYREYESLIAEAKSLPDCFLWMMNISTDTPSNLEVTARCFENAASVATRLDSMKDLAGRSDGDFSRALDLAAEAQSALRISVMRISKQTDRDQFLIFGWLSTIAKKYRYYIPNYMRIDSAADPEAWQNLKERLNAFETQANQLQQNEKLRKKLFSKLAFDVKKLKGAESAPPELWQMYLIKTTDDLLQLGTQPSDAELRDIYIPLMDDMPELPELSKGVQLVLREVDRYLAQSAVNVVEQEEPSVSSDVQTVAGWLAGKTVMLIGGEHRPVTCRRLEKAFGLKELVWPTVRDHSTSVTSFEPVIKRPDLALVLLAIRWSNHSYSEVQSFCERYGKPLVRLPRGYNENQVAHEIIAQASGKINNLTEDLCTADAVA